MVSDECINNLKSESRLRLAAGYFQQISSKMSHTGSMFGNSFF